MKPKAIKIVPEKTPIPAGTWFYLKKEHCEIYQRFYTKERDLLEVSYIVEGLESPIMPIDPQVGHFYTIQNGNDEFFAEVISFHGHAAKYLNVELPDGRRFDLARSEIKVLKEWEAVEYD